MDKTHFVRRPVLRLTLWYVLILTVIVSIFSVVAVALSTSEFERNVDLGGEYQPACLVRGTCEEEEFRQQQVYESADRFFKNLLVFDASIIMLGAIASYFFARRTLRPVGWALERQIQFSSDVAHELRTPLAVMISEIEVELRDKTSTKKSHQKLLESNLEEVNRLREMTDRLLLLSSGIQFSLEEISLKEVIARAIEIVKPRAKQRRVKIASSVEDLAIKGSFGNLVDAIVILLDNAIKYSSAKDEVRIIGRRVGRRTEILVIDQGVGIDPDKINKIFDRFYRVDSARCRTGCEGFGLGLPLAKQIIDLHGGEITVQSAVDKGSTFTIRLG